MTRVIEALALTIGILAPALPENTPAGGDIAWRNVGPGGGGWIQSITADPLREGVLHVGCDVGGYYRSDDASRSYTIQNTGLHGYFIECIAVHPEDPTTIILGAESGIYKSTDDGRSWRWIREGFPEAQRYRYSAPIGALAFDPADPTTVYAGIGRPRFGKEGAGAIYRSDDTGESWSVCSLPGQLPDDTIIRDIEVAAGDRPYIIAATDQGVFRSVDQGTRWAKATGLAHDSARELAMAASHPSIVYATLDTTARDAEPWNGGVYRSDDGGLTFERRSEGLPTRVGKSGAHRAMNSTCQEIVVDPTDSDIAYVGNNSWVSAGVYRTDDGGLTWTNSAYRLGDRTSSYSDYGWLTQWGASVKCMTISPSGSVYFGTSGQVYATDDGGETWGQRYCEMQPDGRFSGTGLEVTCSMDIVPAPHREGRIYLGYNDIGLLITDDGGQTFRRSFAGMKQASNCFTIVPDPEDPDLLWACTGQWASNQGDVCRSSDGGETWQVVGNPDSGLPNGQTRVLRLDANSPRGNRRLYVTCAQNGVYRSTDGGDSWTCISGDLAQDVAGRVRGLLLDPGNAQRIRIAIGGSPSNGAGIYETADGGAAWRKINEGTEFADIRELDVDPSDFDTLYVCQRALYDRQVEPPIARPGGLFKSTDGGRTWSHLLEYHFTECVAVSPMDSNVLYLGTTDHPYHDDAIAAGVLKSEDGGATWQTENVGRSHMNVSSLAVRPDADGAASVMVGTGGNGVFIGTDASPLP